MSPDNFSSGVTALVLIGVIVVGLAVMNYRAIKQESTPRNKEKSHGK